MRETNIKSGRGYGLLILCLIAVSFTFLVYLPSLSNGFVNWDDFLIYTNPHVTSFGIDFFRWAATAEFNGNWHPLTVTAYAVEYWLWGQRAFGFILFNVVLHLLNTALVFFITIRLIDARRPAFDARGEAEQGFWNFSSMPPVAAFAAALLFGIHPLHVESVSWISETKDVMCAFFFLLTVLFYLVYASGGSRRFYVVAVFTAMLAILSKPMAVTLPFVLLILDVYPCGRFSRVETRPAVIKKTLIEKAPFLFFSVMSGVFTLWAQSKGDAISGTIGLLQRLGVAVKGYAFYLYKLVLPFNLAPVYPYPLTDAEIFNAGFAVSAFLLVIIAIICLVTFKRYGWITAAFAYYAVTLAPVSGIIQVGSQSAADRYAYLPTLGFFIVAGVFAGWVAASGRKQLKAALMAAFVFVVSVLSVLTVWQEGVWQNSFTLWSHQILLYPGRVAFAYSNRAGFYFEIGDMDRALADVTESIKIDPKNPKAYHNRGQILFNIGRQTEALKDLDKAIEISPKYVEAFIHRAMMHADMKNFDLALMDYDSVIKLAPESVEARLGRIDVFIKIDKKERAVRELEDILKLKFLTADEYKAVAAVYSRLGRIDVEKPRP